MQPTIAACTRQRLIPSLRLHQGKHWRLNRPLAPWLPSSFSRQSTPFNIHTNSNVSSENGIKSFHEQGIAPDKKVIADMLSKHIRPYFYYIDIHGQVFLQDTVPKNFTSCFKNPRFLDFFIPRIRPNNTPWFSEYAYVSPCGSEMNFIQAADTPVVYHGLHDGQLLWAGTRKTPFLPHMVTVSALTGRIYHPLPPRMVTDSVPISGEQPRQAQEHEQQQEQEQYAYALIKSALVQAEFADGLDDESLEWQGQRYKLRSKT